MFRVTGNLSAVSSPSATSFSAALRFSVAPSLAFASPPRLRWFSTLSRAFLGGRIPSLRPRIPSPCSIRLSGFSALKARASFSSGNSGSNASREILVQQLLAKEDDTQLFAELQKRILDGLFLQSLFPV